MEKINMYRKKLSKSNEIEVKQDLIVPDSKQDIFQILDGNFYSYFNKVEIQNGKIKAYGNVDSYISYISSSEETSILQTTLDFEDVLENNIITEKMNLEYDIKILRYDVKIVNERKVSLSVVLKVVYEVYGTDLIELFNDFNEIEDIQKNSQKIKLKSLIGLNSNVASLKEEIKVDGADIISDIIKVDTNILNKEVKISYNKVLSKADLDIKILYLTKDGRVGKSHEKFPIMSFIDLGNVKEENICSTDYQIRNILLKINNGDENGFTVQMEYEIYCKAFEDKEQEVISDLYSLKYDVEFNTKEIEFENNLLTDSEKTVDIDEKIELENCKKVIDVFGKSKIIKNTISNEFSNIEGETELTIYYEPENKIGLSVKKITVPFISKVSAQNEISSNAKDIEFDFNEKNLIVKGKVGILENNSSKNKINIVQEVTKKEALNQENYSIVVYSVKKNDTLWDISKKFRVKKENIIKSNELEEPYSLNVGEKMYIIR